MINVWKVVPPPPEGFLAMDVVTSEMRHLDNRVITVHVKAEHYPVDGEASSGNPTGKYQIAYRRVPDTTTMLGSVIELLEAQDASLGEGFITLWYNDIARYFEARATKWMCEDKFEVELAR